MSKRIDIVKIPAEKAGISDTFFVDWVVFPHFRAFEAFVYVALPCHPQIVSRLILSGADSTVRNLQGLIYTF